MTPDDRNKLTPIKNLLAILEDEKNVLLGFSSLKHRELFYNELEKAKESLEYIINKDRENGD